MAASAEQIPERALTLHSGRVRRLPFHNPFGVRDEATAVCSMGMAGLPSLGSTIAAHITCLPLQSKPYGIFNIVLCFEIPDSYFYIIGGSSRI